MRITRVTWRLGKILYAEKFRYLMETGISPQQTLAAAEQEMIEVRADMLRLPSQCISRCIPNTATTPICRAKRAKI